MSVITGRDQYDAMWILAVQKHEGQKYGQYDYKDHVDDVVSESGKILEFSTITQDSEEYWVVLAIAAGHDLVEDTDVTLEQLRGMGFNETILSGIGAITRQSGESLTAYVDRIRNTSFYAGIVKKADAGCNLRQSIREGNNRRIEKYTTTIRMLHSL